MKKFNIFLMLIAITAIFAQQKVYSVISQFSFQQREIIQQERNGEKKQQDEFHFFDKLPSDLQNEIVNHAWKEIDNQKRFEEELLGWENVERSKYGFSFSSKLTGFPENRTPIYFYTSDGNNQSIIKMVGLIANHLIDHVSKDSLSYHAKFSLYGPNDQTYSTWLKPGIGENFYILSACFSVLGDIAIIWEDRSQLKEKSWHNVTFYGSTKHVTILKLKDIKDNESIDLNNNAICLQYDEKYLDEEYNIEEWDRDKDPNMTIRSLFSLDGSKVALYLVSEIRSLIFKIPYRSDIGDYTKANHYVEYIDVQQKNPLTIAEKAKRLGIATLGAKKLLEGKQQQK